MNKKLIRLTESDLRRIVKESVNRILTESKGLDPSKRDSNFASNIKWSGEPDLDKANEWRKSWHNTHRGEKKVKGDTKFRDMARRENKRGNFVHKLKTNPNDWFEKSVKESVNRILRESNRREVFTISAFNIENEEDVSDMRHCGQTYYNIDDAIASATEFAQSLIDYGSVVMVTVYAGEYQTESGDIFGEPQDVYTISNSDRRTTAIARKKAGYVTDKVNDYVI